MLRGQQPVSGVVQIVILKSANMETKYNVTDFIIKTIYEPLKEFIEHYETHGMALPPEFASDPGAWLVILKEIEFSFDSIYQDKFGEEPSEAWITTSEAKEEHKKRVNKGLEYFGKYLMYLWD